jgi:hypothetical protein
MAIHAMGLLSGIRRTHQYGVYRHPSFPILFWIFAAPLRLPVSAARAVAAFLPD